MFLCVEDTFATGVFIRALAKEKTKDRQGPNSAQVTNCACQVHGLLSILYKDESVAVCDGTWPLCTHLLPQGDLALPRSQDGVLRAALPVWADPRAGGHPDRPFPVCKSFSSFTLLYTTTA